MLFPEPADDHLPRPVMIVVQVQDDRVERQPLVAALGTLAADVLEAIEQAIEPRPNRAGFLRQRICAFVRRAQRARAALVRKVFAESPIGTPPGTFRDGISQFYLICARDLMHPRLHLARLKPSRYPAAFYARAGLRASVRKRTAFRYATLWSGCGAVRGVITSCACCLCCLRRFSVPPLRARRHLSRRNRRSPRTPRKQRTPRQ